LSMRRRFGLAEWENSLTDQLLVAETCNRTVVLVVNAVTGVVEKSDKEITKATKVVPGSQYVDGITRLEDGLLFIHDLDRFLSPSEDAAIHGLLTQAKGAV
jgi:purine-binding chemotaxis protein CheW